MSELDDTFPRHTPPVTSTRNGWHTMTMTCSNPARGYPRTWEIRWRSHKFSCCYSQQPIVWDATHQPVLSGNSWGEPQFAAQQCGGCGTQHTHNYTAKEITP